MLAMPKRHHVQTRRSLPWHRPVTTRRVLPPPLFQLQQAAPSVATTPLLTHKTVRRVPHVHMPERELPPVCPKWQHLVRKLCQVKFLATCVEQRRSPRTERNRCAVLLRRPLQNRLKLRPHELRPRFKLLPRPLKHRLMTPIPLPLTRRLLHVQSHRVRRATLKMVLKRPRARAPRLPKMDVRLKPQCIMAPCVPKALNTPNPTVKLWKAPVRPRRSTTTSSRHAAAAADGAAATAHPYHPSPVTDQGIANLQDPETG